MMYRIYANGIIEVITGPMFSGKSEELIKRIKILGHAKISTLVAKPDIDTRWEQEKVLSRAGTTIETASFKNSKELLEKFKKNNYQALAIDEVQFFDKKIIEVIINLANSGIRVIVSGLDQDYQGKPFGMMPELLAVADLVDKQQAVCSNCGKAATMTYRKPSVSSKKQILVGDEEYEPRCRECHNNGNLENVNESETISLDIKNKKIIS